MTVDRWMVLDGLRHCTRGVCEGCPYKDPDKDECENVNVLMCDALEVLEGVSGDG